MISSLLPVNLFIALIRGEDSGKQVSLFLQFTGCGLAKCEGGGINFSHPRWEKGDPATFLSS